MTLEGWATPLSFSFRSSTWEQHTGRAELSEDLVSVANKTFGTEPGTSPMLSNTGALNTALQPLLPSFCPSDGAKLPDAGPLPMLFPLPGTPYPRTFPQLAPSQDPGRSLKALSRVGAVLPAQSPLPSLNPDVL